MVEIISLVIACISLGISLVCLKEYKRKKVDPLSKGELQYVMYVGTNDKDTYKLETTKENAMKVVDTICHKYFEGYTIQEAIGSWTDRRHNVTHEYTIVCYFDNTDLQTVYKAADEIIEQLNQNTVLIEQDLIEIEYYAGSKNKQLNNKSSKKQVN